MDLRETQTYQAVIFDLYGTLVNYLPSDAYSQCHKEIASMLGVSDEEMAQAWRGYIGDRKTGRFPVYEGCLAHVCECLGIRASHDQICGATNIRLQLIRRNLCPRDGALDLLSALRSTGHLTGVISDCLPEVPRIWPETAFLGLIDQAVFSSDTGVTKPDETIYMLACDKLGVQPDQCLYVGDGGSHELTGARHVGMHSILLQAEDGNAHVPKRPDAVQWNGQTITDLREIASLLGMPPWK